MHDSHMRSRCSIHTLVMRVMLTTINIYTHGILSINTHPWHLVIYDTFALICIGQALRVNRPSDYIPPPTGFSACMCWGLCLTLPGSC
jgi:hypothetical protein